MPKPDHARPSGHARNELVDDTIQLVDQALDDAIR